MVDGLRNGCPQRPLAVIRLPLERGYRSMVIMRWFDRPYATGELDEDEWAARPAQYAAHLDSISSQLDRGAEVLVGLDLHDGQVAEWEYVEGVTFIVRLLTGDLQVGYTWLTLGYQGASLIGVTTSELNRWLGADATEIIEHEVAVDGSGSFEHRMLLWPEGEFGVRFDTLETSRVDAPASARR